MTFMVILIINILTVGVSIPIKGIIVTVEVITS